MTLQKKSDHTEYIILNILHYCNSNRFTRDHENRLTHGEKEIGKERRRERTRYDCKLLLVCTQRNTKSHVCGDRHFQGFRWRICTSLR